MSPPPLDEPRGPLPTPTLVPAAVPSAPLGPPAVPAAGLLATPRPLPRRVLVLVDGDLLCGCRAGPAADLGAALVFTFARAYGAPVELAATAVVGYRVLTVWLPLLPGALLLSVLVQRKVL
ncbi:hypothetical protein FBY22_1460 [Streptomyces sp. SLBN-31]|nr:hypothetical protein FBY22_1460 [Streptomyces sp. SLBN-31]